MNKYNLLKRITTIQSKMQDLYSAIGTNGGMHCQTIMRELAQLEKKIEMNEIKPKK